MLDLRLILPFRPTVSLSDTHRKNHQEYPWAHISSERTISMRNNSALI